MTRDELELLREDWDFEGKLAQGRDGRGALPDDLWPTYSAMANTNGGRIVLGIKERSDGSFELRGIHNIERVERELWNLLRSPQKVSTNLLSQGDVAREVIDGVTILVLNVPRAPRTARPVFINGDIWTGTYLRSHDGDSPVRDRERIRRMIAEAEFDSRDNRILPGFGLQDLDPSTLRAYRNHFKSEKPDHPWLALDDEPFLEQLGAFGTNHETKERGLTAAGLLMFGTWRALQDAFPNYFVDYQERGEATGAIEWVDRVIPDGIWSGNVFDFYRKAIVKLVGGLKVPFLLRDGVQRVDDTHVHEAIREALINALIHADYEGRISILAVRKPDGFEFRNPGTSRVAIEQIREGGASDCRNRTLQKMFMLLGIGEEAGSGFSRILRAWREQSWRSPAITEDVDLDTTTLTLSTESLLPEVPVAELSRRFAAEFTELQPEGRVVLVTALLEGAVDHERLRQIVGIPPRDLTVLLQRLVRKGMLEKLGQGRGCSYQLASPAHLTPSPAHLTPSPAHLEGEPRPIGTEPQSVSPIVERVARSGKATQAAVRAAILEACREKFLTPAELGQLLNRQTSGLAKNYLRQMVAEGLLERRFPENESDPRQAYRAF